jgi:hypothetical protein
VSVWIKVTVDAQPSWKGVSFYKDQQLCLNQGRQRQRVSDYDEKGDAVCAAAFARRNYWKRLAVSVEQFPLRTIMGAFQP